MRKVLQNWKALAFAAIMTAGLGYSVDTKAAATLQNAMCVKTNTGNYFPVVRVSMMVIPDGKDVFEIILKEGEGEGEANVKSISFERKQVEIDYSKYGQQGGGQQTVDYSKPFYVFTNTGKFWKMVDQRPVLTVQEGTSLMTLTAGSVVEPNVSEVRFFRGTEEELNNAMNSTGIDTPLEAPNLEKLQLQTPISEQMTVSGCGDATKALVYALDGKQMTEAPVANGVTTVTVGQLPAGVYVLRVGKKALKFTKK